jgi:uncharacterized protein (TIGR00255 family)
MKSMTGFGRGESISRGIRYSVEIFTVNRRAAEILFNLPREISSLESVLRDVISPAIARGRATVTASVSSGDTPRPMLDPILFRRLRDELICVQRTLKIPGTPALSDLVRLYATAARDTASVIPTDTKAVIKAARAALQAMETMRSREGSHLQSELVRLLDRFAKEIAVIGRLAPQVTAKHRAALQDRLAEIAPTFAIEDERLARELALFADRSDITEELSRLESHLKQFRTGLSSGNAQGRSLDFLAQEMFRECNTIGAKANSAQIAQRVIAAKTELERIREQVQNVE